MKGDNHTIIGNLALDNKEGLGKFRENWGTLLVIHQVRYQNVTMNKNTMVRNNAAIQADGGTCLKLCQSIGLEINENWPLAGITENNYSGKDLKNLLTDVDNKDFRPKASDVFTRYGTGKIIGDKTRNLIGPYLSKGQTITQYAIPGQKLDIASHPIPMNGSVVKGRDTLMFRPAFR